MTTKTFTWFALLPVISAAVTNLNSLVGISLSTLGKNPTSGIDNGAANTLVFLDLFKHSTPFTRYQPESEQYIRAPGVYSAQYSPSQLPSFRTDQYPVSLFDGLVYGVTATRTTVKSTIGFGGNQLPSGTYVCRYKGVGTLTFSGDAALISSDTTNKM
jgi:hypothetical protein